MRARAANSGSLEAEEEEDSVRLIWARRGLFLPELYTEGLSAAKELPVAVMYASVMSLEAEATEDAV